MAVDTGVRSALPERNAGRSPRGGGPLRRPRRGALALVGGIVAASLLTVLVVDLTGGGRSAQKSAPARFATPSAYHITYVVRTPGTPTGTEQLWVRRPFESVDVTLDGAPPGRTATLTMVYQLGAQVLNAGTALPTLLRVPAAASPLAVRADVVVPAGLATGRLRRVGTATIAGRRCELFRSAAPLRSAP